jgi:hypothetical protein
MAQNSTIPTPKLVIDAVAAFSKVLRTTEYETFGRRNVLAANSVQTLWSGEAVIQLPSSSAIEITFSRQFHTAMDYALGIRIISHAPDPLNVLRAFFATFYVAAEPDCMLDDAITAAVAAVVKLHEAAMFYHTAEGTTEVRSARALLAEGEQLVLAPLALLLEELLDSSSISISRAKRGPLCVEAAADTDPQLLDRLLARFANTMARNPAVQPVADRIFRALGQNGSSAEQLIGYVIRQQAPGQYHVVPLVYQQQDKGRLPTVLTWLAAKQLDDLVVRLEHHRA